MNGYIVSARADLTPLPAKAAKEIALRWPQIDLGDVQSAFQWYLTWREADRMPSAQWLECITGLEAKLGALCNATADLKHNAIGTAITGQALRAGVDGGHNLLSRFIRDAETLLAIMPAVRASIRQGRAPTPRAALVHHLAALLQEQGLAPNKTPNGPLCGLVSVLLQAAGEGSVNAPRIVGPVLEISKPPVN